MQVVLEHPDPWRFNDPVRCATTSTSNGAINLYHDLDDEWLIYEKLTENALLRYKRNSQCNKQSKFPNVVRPKSILFDLQVADCCEIIFDERADGDKVTTPASQWMRKSLFPNVPPYVYFHSHERKQAVKLPKEFTKLLKWKFTGTMPKILVKILINSGYQTVLKTNDWSAIWNLSCKDPTRYQRMKSFQKINSIPGSHNLGNKDSLWNHLSKMMKKFGTREYGFMPKTYILPREIQKFENVWLKNGIANTWIIKPPSSGRGQGIKIVNQWWEIPKWHLVVVQRYITKPKLINGLKFDLRLYVLLTSLNPMRIYIYKEGLVRFASVRYVRGGNLNDKYMHLTNSSVNRQNPAYVKNDGVNSFKGHKWSLRCLWSYLEQEGVDVAELWSKIKDIVVKTFIAVEPTMNVAISEYLVSSYTCYELYGFDILLDENFKPWLLEANILPSLQTESPLDTTIKGALIRNVLNMAGYQIPRNERISGSCKKFESIMQDHRLYSMALNLEEKMKQNEINAMQKRDEYFERIIDKLTRDDLRQLIRYEDELSQAENFEKIFPTKRTYEYEKFFDVKRYYDRLLDAWEQRYSDNRREGIERLRRHCEKMQHLQMNPN
ncbi:tubulin monoglutamylase TTLL4 isoform X1 [Osmia lignaria lignaria]|uniref:tubulin monoglutamylase TTLL4 isoform X1 n=1 Tax=Osmia lignaria lignaria TaxID=1437193 RepID=UPI001478CEEA|nr:tubulin polyglutamylase TTLL4-like isoform X1 [Osmia lignaria]